MPIIRYIVVPFVLALLAWFLFVEFARRHPLYVVAAVAVVIVIAQGREQRQKKRDAQRGWRVGHVGRDSMYYEELREGSWHRILVDGEMLVGKAHHVIYFTSTRFPEWANERREEIIRRIKSEFHPPLYEYDDA